MRIRRQKSRLNQFHISLATFFLLTNMFFNMALAQPCQINRVDLKGDWGQVSFRISVADNARQRALGLMHVESMPTNAGMLFVYPHATKVSFWMKNTLIPLDMLFFDERGFLIQSHKNAQPHDLASKYGGPNVKFVLEINGGLSDIYGIFGETFIRHPSIGINALWPC